MVVTGFLPASTGRWWRSAGGVILGAWLCATLGTWWLLPGAKPDRVWAASTGGPVPSDFHYAMFPSDADIPVFDQPDGKRVGGLRRAMANVESEVRAGGWAELQDPAGARWVRIADLVYRPPAGAGIDYFAAFESAYQAQDPTDFRTASLEFEEGAPGVAVATLHLGQDDGWQEYVYRLSGASATPVAMYRMHGPTVGIIEGARLVGAVMAGAGAAALVGFGWKLVEWRRRQARSTRRSMR